MHHSLFIRDEIIAIAKEVASSLVQDILDVFKGDFEIDTNIASIAGDYKKPSPIIIKLFYE